MVSARLAEASDIGGEVVRMISRDDGRDNVISLGIDMDIEDNVIDGSTDDEPLLVTTR